MTLFRSIPTTVEAVQWKGDNLSELLLSTNARYDTTPPPPHDGLNGEEPIELRLLAGKDGAQEFVPVPVGHWIVCSPDDQTDFWPDDPDYFAAKYQPHAEAAPVDRQQIAEPHLDGVVVLPAVRQGSSLHVGACPRSNPDLDLPRDVACTCANATPTVVQPADELTYERRLLTAHRDAVWLARCGRDGDPGRWFIPGGYLPVIDGGELEVEAYPIYASLDDQGVARGWSAHMTPGPNVVPCWEWRINAGWDDLAPDQVEALDKLGGCPDDHHVALFALGSHNEPPTITDELCQALAIVDHG